MSSSQNQPIPKAPAERTLQAAVTILSVAALVQIVAAGLALAPRIDFEKMGRTLAPRPETAPPAPAVAQAPPAPAATPEDNATKANELLDEAQKFRERGNFRGALEAVTEADRLVPNKPGILILMAHDYNQLGKTAETLAVLRKIVALPAGSDPSEATDRLNARNALAQLTGTADAYPADTPAATPAAAAEAAPAKDASGVRDEVGIQVGSVMGIVDVKFVDAEPGQKNLSVSTKAASGQKIDPAKFNATVDFYEQNDHGEVEHNDSPRPTEWLSGPAIDWANSDPEIFQVKYRLPLADRGDLPPLQYYGYVIAIYYDGELQDQRADPPALLNDHAPPLHKDVPTE